MHLLLHLCNHLLQFLTAHGFRILLELHLFLCDHLGNTDQLADRLFDGLGSDAVLLIVLLLDGPTTVGLIQGNPHGICNGIRVHDDMTLRISCRTADGLNQGGCASKEAFLVRIQYGYQGNLRNIQTLTKQVDSHQYIEHIQTHVTDDFRPFQRIDVGMQVLYPDANLLHIIGQILRHLLGQSGNQHLVMLGGLLIDLPD